MPSYFTHLFPELEPMCFTLFSPLFKHECLLPKRIKKMGVQTLLLINERKKEKNICCFVIKRAKKTHKKEELYTYKNTRTNTRVLLHTYIHCITQYYA